MMEDDASLPVGSARCRKRLHSGGHHDFKGNPSIGDLGRYQEEEKGEKDLRQEEEEEQRWCRRCHIMVAHLERQAAVLKDSPHPFILSEELSLGSTSADARCGLCGSSHQQLRIGALRRALGVTGMTEPGPARPPNPLSPSTSQNGELPSKQLKCTYLGEGRTEVLAKVMPLPPMAEHLEGLWKITSPQDSAVQDVPIKPASHSITTATRQPQTSPGAFLLRTAQKLSLSRRKTVLPEPTSPANEASESLSITSKTPESPLCFTGGSNAAQIVSSPALSQNFFRVGSKLKDLLGKDISGLSGDETSCEDCLSCPPPQPQPFHPWTLAPKSIPGPPDHTVLHVGPGGKEVFGQELSDRRGLPSSLPIVPSLNKKPAKDACILDGDHLKCSTFAELQERLEGIADCKVKVPNPKDTASSRTSRQKSSERTTKTQTKPWGEERSRYPTEVWGYQAELGWCHPELGDQHAEVGWNQAEVGWYHTGVGGYHSDVGGYQNEVGGYRATLLGRCVDGGFVSATMALQREVGLNWEDELVFTVIEEIPHGFVLGSGHPSHRLGPDRPLQPEPISIIGSINDEYDVWTSVAPPASSWCGMKTPSALSWPCDVDLAQTLDESSVSLRSIDSDPTTALLKGAPEMRAPWVSVPCHTATSSLPSQSPPPLSGASQQDTIWLDLDPVEVSSSGTSRSDISTLRSGGKGGWISRPPKAHLQAKKIPDVGEESCRRKGETPFKLPRLIRASVTHRNDAKPQSSQVIGGQDAVTEQRSSTKGRLRGPKTNVISRFWSGVISSHTPVTRQSGKDPKKTTVASPRTSTQSNIEGKFLQTYEEEFTTGIQSLKKDRGPPKTSFSPKTPKNNPNSRQKYGSLGSGGSAGLTTAGFVMDSDAAASGGNNRSNRPKHRELVSLATPSQTTLASSDKRLRRVSSGSGLKAPTLFCSSRNSSTPLKQEGRGTLMGTKQVLIQAASSRGSKLAAGSPINHLSPEPVSGRSLTSVSSLSTTLPSPYSKVTEPRKPRRHSGEQLPIMGRSALRYHSGGSSGYESIILDSETAGSSASSAPDSTSESGVSSINKTRISRSPKRRGNGTGRRRIIPAPLLDTCLLGKRPGFQEPFKIKVYQIEEDPILFRDPVLRSLQRRQNLIQELRRKNQELEEELQEAQSRLCPNRRRRRSNHVDLDPDLDPDSQDYLQLLIQVRGDLEDRLLLSKSHLLMETCFDICGSINRPQAGPVRRYITPPQDQGIEPGPRGGAGP